MSEEEAKRKIVEEEKVKKCSTVENIKVLHENGNDLDFVGRNQVKRPQKIDVMGQISATADRLGLSIRQRVMMAASVANTLDIDIDNTNIRKSAAHDKGKKERRKAAKAIKENFQNPDRVVVYWDRKILKLKGNTLNNRVCVHHRGD